MPQSEHLMLGIPGTPSSPQMLRLQNENCASGKNSPALSHKSYTSVKQPPAVVKKKNPHKSAKSTTRNSGTKNAKGKEGKEADFSVRWELQLSAFVLICFFIGLVVPLSMIIIGSVYVFDCSQEVMIPVFLIVFGSTFLASIYGLRRLSRRKETQMDDASYRSVFWTIVLFQLGWFAAGCYWVYKTYEPNYIANDEGLYCNRTLYQYAFWLLNSIFIVLGMAIITFLIFVVCGMQKTPNTPTPV